MYHVKSFKDTNLNPTKTITPPPRQAIPGSGKMTNIWRDASRSNKQLAKKNQSTHNQMSEQEQDVPPMSDLIAYLVHHGKYVPQMSDPIAYVLDHEPVLPSIHDVIPKVCFE